RFSHPFVPGNEFHVAAAFARLSLLRRIIEKILERPKQERTEAPAIRVGVLEPVRFKHHHKEILRQVLRVLSRITTPANKRENGPPISPAKLGQGVARLLLFAFGIGGGKDETPPRSREHARLASTLAY